MTGVESEILRLSLFYGFQIYEKICKKAYFQSVSHTGYKEEKALRTRF